LNAIDLAPYRVNAYGGTFDVTFVGTQADSSTVEQVFTVTRSNGATPVLQRFYFSGFTNLIRVTWLQGVAPEAETSYQFNNVTVNEESMPVSDTSLAVCLGAPRPNPSASTVAVPVFALSCGSVEVEVFGADGRRIGSVRGVAGGGGGWIELPWNGLDEQGIPVPAGVYFVRGTGHRAQSQKIVVVR
jgi:hypothetical protein